MVNTPASFNVQALDFSRLFLADVTTRATQGIAIYPLTSLGNILSINITNTNINIRYTSNTVTTNSVNYVNKSFEQVCQEINSLAIPIKAIALIPDAVLQQGDLFIYDATEYYRIPENFRTHDRLTSNGIIIRTRKYSIRHKNLVNFKILSPYSQSVLLPWYPLITNGQFVQRYRERLYHYAIPEFDNQVWSIRYGKPFKDVLSGTLTRVGNNAYRVARTPIYWTGENLNIYNNDVPYSNSIIKDVDVNNGIIYFNDNIILGEDVRIDYTYLEKNFEYRGININAHFSQNPSLLDKFVLIYANPLEGSDYARNKKTINHIIADSIEGGIQRIGSINIDLPPVIIGGYGITQVSTSDRIRIFDCRSLGGGLLSNEGPLSPVQQYRYGYIDATKPKQSPIESFYKEAKSFWDIGNWDGEIYPGAAAITMSFPESLRTKFGKKEVIERASKFVAAGVYPVVEYYPDSLPGITGRSTQISLVLNGDFKQSINNVSGLCWIRSDTELPGSAVTGSWPSDFVTPPYAYKVDNTGVLLSGPLDAVHQTYLKSTPISAIEYYSRSVTTVTGSKDDTAVYSPWEKTVIYDNRTVPQGWLCKGYVDFTRSAHTTEIRSVKVNSPFRLDFTGNFKSDLQKEIQNVHEAIQGRTNPTTVRAIDGSNLVTYPITYNYRDIETMELAPIAQYFGVGEGYNYVFDLIGSDLEETYSSTIDLVGKQIYYSVTGYNGNDFFKFFALEAGYQSFTDISSVSGIDIKNAIEQLCKYAAWRKDNYGTSDALYTGMRQKIAHIVTSIDVTTDNYLPKTYIATNADTSPVFVPERHAIPTGSGLLESEISAQYNTDSDYLYMNSAICSSALAIDNFSGSLAATLATSFAVARNSASYALGRLRNAVTGLRTYTGIPVVQSWYMPYNRYGTYLGSVSKQLIDCYDYIYTAQINASGVSLSGNPGMDVSTLYWYFSGIQYALDAGYSGIYETVARNGILEPAMADTIYAYGWFAEKAHNHFTYVDHYRMTGHSTYGHSHEAEMEMLASEHDHSTAEKFYGLFKTGLYTLVKGMTTTNSSMIEATIVNGDIGPFEPKVPTKIIDALAIGCKLNKDLYLPLAQAVFNTLTGNYSVNGMYWKDPLKSLKNAGNEDVISSKFVKLYKEL
jgi:hypothetical protein